MRHYSFSLFSFVTAISLAAGAASAADLRKVPPVVAPPPPAAPWTGFYAGVNGGYSVGTDPFTQDFSIAGVPQATSPIESNVTPKGALFGGQLGYNYQTGNAVFGLEGDFQWTNQHNTAGCGLTCITVPGVLNIIEGSAEQRIKWFATARGRLGWASNGWLLYITGGGAWAGIDATTAFSSTSSTLSVAFSNTTGFTKGGWVFGGGAEVRIAGPWSAKLEYLYMDLGSITDTLSISVPPSPPFALRTDSKIRDNIFRVGLNYKIY
jgi:outer membrane immunogenic protein